MSACSRILVSSHEIGFSSHHASQITIHPFDARYDSSSLGILLPSHTLQVLSLTRQHSSLASRPVATHPARAASSLAITRPGIKDLVILTPDGSVKVLLWAPRELNISLSFPTTTTDPNPPKRKPIALHDPVGSCLTFEFDDGSRARASMDLSPQDYLVRLGFEALARVVPVDEGWEIRKTWLEARWGETTPDPSTRDKTEFECFSDAVCKVFLDAREGRDVPALASAWEALSSTRTHARIRDEQMFTAAGLALPEPDPAFLHPRPVQRATPGPTSPYLAPAMLALHLAAQTLVTDVTKMDRLVDIGALVLKLARQVRPDYVDYWSRLCCDAPEAWLGCVGNGKSRFRPRKHPT
jgi:anaphase-promoting complex subunit 1